MKRPMPPELVILGDHLESAARRSVGRRLARRQSVLNAVASLLIALPLLPAVLGTIAPPVAPIAFPPNKTAYAGAKDDFPPRVLRGAQRPADDVLAEPTTLRRAVR